MGNSQIHSYVNHLSRTGVLCFREDYWVVTEKNNDATILLGIFDFWDFVKREEVAQIRIESVMREEENQPPLVISPYIYKTHQELINESYGLIPSRTRIIAAIRFLCKKNFLAQVPNRYRASRYKFGYTLQVDKINESLGALQDEADNRNGNV
jgi:hypothetical protein